MSLLNRIENSKFSLLGNRFDPSPGIINFGYLAKNQSTLLPGRGFSNLHNQYSVNSLDRRFDVTTMRIVNFNKTPYPSYVPLETSLDPLDSRAPKNTFPGVTTYVNVNNLNNRNLKGAFGTYSSIGPEEGRY